MTMLFSGVCAASLDEAVAASAGDSDPVWSQRHQRVAEPVAFIRPTDGGAPTGKLALSAAKIQRIYSNDSTREYPVTDFKVEGNKVTYIGQEELPCIAEGELFPESGESNAIGFYKDGKRYLLYATGGFFPSRQLYFDYESSEAWTPAPPEDQSALLPKLHAKLKSDSPVTVAILGDSISEGADAFLEPPFFDRLGKMLGQRFGKEIKVVNFSKGGESSFYGVAKAPEVAELKPDLVIIGFGMNDGSGNLRAEDFAGNIRSIMKTISKESPETEFVIINAMTPNPEWSLSNMSVREGYPKALQRLSGKGHAICDVRTTWDFLVERKGYWSITGNGVNHPNDYGHKLYADALYRSITGENVKGEKQ